MFNPGRRGWLTVTTVALLSAGALSAATTSSQAQFFGMPGNTGAQIGSTTPFGPGALYGYGMGGSSATYNPLQLAYLQQLSSLNPYAQAALSSGATSG